MFGSARRPWSAGSTRGGPGLVRVSTARGVNNSLSSSLHVSLRSLLREGMGGCIVISIISITIIITIIVIFVGRARVV